MSRSPTSPHIVWIYDGELERALDAATWLDTAAALRRSGWRVTLLAAGKPGLHKIRGVEVLCLWQPHIYLLRHIAFHLGVLWIILRRFRTIDVILFHEASAPWIVPLRLLRQARSRPRPLLVMDSRSLPMPPQQGQSLRGRLRRAAHGITTEWGNRLADGRLAITSRLAEAVHIPPLKLWGTWPSGADTEHFGVALPARRWPSAGEPIRLLYHGALHHERNLMAACRAVVLANSEGERFELLLVGRGGQEAELQAFARENEGCVQLLAPIPFDKMPELLAEVHVGILPFPDEEKFRVSSPIKLFEYMASGMPIVVTRIVCHTDVVGTSTYAFWAEDSTEIGLLDALRQVWARRAQLPSMGREAAQAAAAWTWDASAAKLRTALEIGLG